MCCLELNGSYFKVKIEGFSSLKSLSLGFVSLEEATFHNMCSLRKLRLCVRKGRINNDFLTKLFEMCPNIQDLSLICHFSIIEFDSFAILEKCQNIVAVSLIGSFSNINLDGFVNLKRLKLCGELLDDFNNFDIFRNICNRLEELLIKFKNMDDEIMSNLLYDCDFPNLSSFKITTSKITRLEKKLFDRFNPMLEFLSVCHNDELRTIDKEAFSSLKNLKYLYLVSNQLSELDSQLFSTLENLEDLRLAFNRLTHFDVKIKDYIVNIKEMHLYGNEIANKQEISDHFIQPKCLLKFDFKYRRFYFF